MSKWVLYSLLSVGINLLFVFGKCIAADPVNFEREVLPIFYHHCFACHSEKQDKPKGGMRLDSKMGIAAGDVIAAGKPDDSELMKRVSLPHSDKNVMPPLKGGAQPLNDAERSIIRRWIAEGAKTGSWEKLNHRGEALAIDEASYSFKDARQLSLEVQKRIDQFHLAKGTRLNPPASDEA
ncbi:hypothetical protein EBX93_04735, partial [bacterium]|nr:hypothetical protein [bacterium]